MKAIARATRSGVRFSPSRSGFSPRSSSWRRKSAAYSASASGDSTPGGGARSLSCVVSLSASVFDIVVVGLPEHETSEGGGGDGSLEDAPERDDHVLRRRNHALHEGNVNVEVVEIDGIHH